MTTARFCQHRDVEMLARAFLLSILDVDKLQITANRGKKLSRRRLCPGDPAISPRNRLLRV